jgi:DNA-binding CsgD family transcriptional regulator
VGEIELATLQSISQKFESGDADLTPREADVVEMVSELAGLDLSVVDL